MPPIKSICALTGKPFEISELEQALRKKLQVPMPDVHPYERMRALLAWRNIFTLYNYTCDLCKKPTLTFYNPTNTFPKYCRECWFSDAWQPPEQAVNFNRPFFPQMQELINKTPTMALSVSGTIENSDYNNAATGLKNCYMCFNAGYLEDCYYTVTVQHNKNTVDVFAAGNSEIAYECTQGSYLFNVMWSDNIISCRDSLFLYDCEDCANCFMSAGFRHKSYVWRNEELPKEEYQKRMSALDTGSYTAVQQLKEEYQNIKKQYRKKCIIGIKNENVSGNLLYGCKNTEDSYIMDSTENCVNCYDMVDHAYDCLDVCSFGYRIEGCYNTIAAGLDSYNIRYSYVGIEKSTNLEYCFQCRNCSDCFGCVSLRKKQYCIFNKLYTKEGYGALREKLIAHMREVGEYGRFFPTEMCPFGYNETMAQLTMPLTREEAVQKGFKWHEKEVPQFLPEQIYAPPDNIKDARWEDLEGKVIICKKSKRPFKIVKPEFEFYQKYNIPLPRLHPEVRLAQRYPTNELYNLHTTTCTECGITLKTSMPSGDKILCEKCYLQTIY